MERPSSQKQGGGELLSPRLDLALRSAALWHDGQRRKASPVPYVQHPMAVALILDRLGFDEDVVIAALLHDAVEDTDASLDQVRERFGDRVAELVGHCSEQKRDPQGNPRPWADRKRDHLEALRSAPMEARAIVLADKLHNLQSIAADLAAGGPVWDRFNAGRDQVIAGYRAAIDGLSADPDPRIEALARRGRAVLSEIEGEPSRALPTGEGRAEGPSPSP
ncbi:HD domain-containing protein [Tautonia sociabilis]|uniref:HD domain-containing protein n=1 Tax=Tautonia sociabilis TaxID=2080755 RepID=A0A432MGB5_9BACT|nr:HD domain-containing protein [Tautonia sociabilis]RUL85522.1 HD domain-containing protein [Tautonia sociabilis]